RADRPGQPGRTADHRGDVVARVDGLLEQLPADAAGRREDSELHLVLLVPVPVYSYPDIHITREAYHMNPVQSESADPARRRRRPPHAVKASLRDLSGQLSLLDHRVSTRLDLKASDLDCLELVFKHGPLSPSELARRAGLHPATMTGVLDRLERGGWVS